MKNLIVTTIVFSIWLTAQAETSSLETALASLTVAVENAKKDTAAKQNAYNAATKNAGDLKKQAETAKAAADKRAADAATQAESMKAAIAKAAEIEKMTLAAHESLKKVTPIPPKSALEKALAAVASAVDTTKKETAARQNAYNAAVKKAGDLKKQGETAKVADDKKASDRAKQAESMKAAVTKAAEVEKMALAALGTLKLAIEASK